jgi:hypothetical protein
VARYYLVNERRYLPVSNEVTGYVASTHAYLHRKTGDRRHLDAAVKAARFLTRQAWRPELRTFPFENGAPLQPAYFFDSGMVVRGLLAVFRLTGDPEFYRIAEEAGRSMARDFLTPEAMHPVIDLPSKKPRPHEPHWSREPGCFLLKASLVWRELAAVGGEAHREFYERALPRTLADYRRFLPGAEGDRVMDRLHAFGYFLEGLLPAADCAEARRALVAGMETMARLLQDGEPAFVRSDVCAQLLRVRLWAESLWGVPLDKASAAREANAIAGFQQQSTDVRVDGGFCFGRRNGEFLPYANAVATAFCVQALAMWEARQSGEDMPDLADLI